MNEESSGPDPETDVITRLDEKRRRIYYQNIVYHVCNSLDAIDHKQPGAGIVCGTVDEPSTAVQDRMRLMAAQFDEIASILSASGQRSWSDGCRLGTRQLVGFHTLWTACVGKPGYNKAAWLEIERQLHAAGLCV